MCAARIQWEHRHQDLIAALSSQALHVLSAALRSKMYLHQTVQHTPMQHTLGWMSHVLGLIAALNKYSASGEKSGYQTLMMGFPLRRSSIPAVALPALQHVGWPLLLLTCLHTNVASLTSCAFVGERQTYGAFTSPCCHGGMAATDILSLAPPPASNFGQVQHLMKIIYESAAVWYSAEDPINGLTGGFVCRHGLGSTSSAAGSAHLARHGGHPGACPPTASPSSLIISLRCNFRQDLSRILMPSHETGGCSVDNVHLFVLSQLQIVKPVCACST